MSFYPEKVQEAANAAFSRVIALEPDAEGVAVSFECGCFIRFYLNVRGQAVTAGFRTNGCGYMLAAATTLAGLLNESQLQRLHGLEPFELSGQVYADLGEFPVERRQCCGLAIDAVASAFAAYRLKRTQEFSGERALICTCFGISEDTIDELIRRRNLTELSQVSDACNAGSGCGSCRMLIQEMLDSARGEADML